MTSRVAFSVGLRLTQHSNGTAQTEAGANNRLFEALAWWIIDSTLIFAAGSWAGAGSWELADGGSSSASHGASVGLFSWLELG
ncbi:hypothetical protein PoB_005427100 [Plakobranchus ocellatus]|uniref:Uncharacterized protein n=1 Tax=Plakobranchus ocellatus TaxID=259542 RepID=A0AAV4C8V4_9GAST|nr:hypothetical protein PoB_005427100 [Plakobranchus ocellatus]